MSLLSIDDWQNFLFNVGDDFYDLVHGESETNDEFTKIDFSNPLVYDGVTMVYNSGGQSRDYSVPWLCHVNVSQGTQRIVELSEYCFNSNITSNYALGTNIDKCDIIDTSGIYCVNSYIATNNNYWVGSDNLLWMKNASDVWNNNIFGADIFLRYTKSNDPYYDIVSTNTATGIKCSVSYGTIGLTRNYNGYDYYFDSSNLSQFYDYYSFPSTYYLPTRLKSSPVIVNTSLFNVNSSVNYFKQEYINNGDTITNYTYNIDTNNYITVNYSVDSNGEPSGYIDIQPTGNISFDDLFDMFNTILAPLVGVGLDLPDWTDYEPEYPIVTGDINVNIDIPDVIGEYPAETITPIESDVYNIMSIDSLPQLPSLTGVDNGETAAALGSSFTFLDGCGLLMPFVTIAIIRLLISKFRGDS